MRDDDTTQGTIDETDVEGHRHLAKDAEPEGAKHLAKDAETESARARTQSFEGSDDDVEGHRQMAKDAEPEGIFRAGPTTQGEILRRGPGDNPHGDR